MDESHLLSNIASGCIMGFPSDDAGGRVFFFSELARSVSSIMSSEIQGVFWRIRTVLVCKLLIPLSQQFCRAQNIFFPVYDTCGLKQMIVDKVLISHRPNRPW